jgi:hypothetical protein
MSEAVADVWLPVPTAIFLLLTGDLARVCELTGADAELLVIRVTHALPRKAVYVPLDPAATKAQRIEALQTARKRLSIEARGTDLYSAGLSALAEILSDGRARAKGSRTPDGPMESIDPAEFTRVQLVRDYAAHKKTKGIVWYDLRVSAHDLLKFRQAVGELASCPSADGDKKAPAEDRRQVRLKYLGMLEQLVATLGDKFHDMSDNGIARRFLDQCKARLGAGNPVPKLPQLRHIETQVKRIRARRIAAAPNRTDRGGA